jgi:hypothetical protein
MSEKPTTDATFEAMKRDRERHLQEAAALEQRMAKYAQLKDLAAEFDVDLVPTAAAPPRLETISDLIAVYKTSPASAYQKLKFASKRHYEAVLGMIEIDHGPAQLSKITVDDLKEWYREWGLGGRVSSSHAKIGMLRGICGFGIEVLKDGECGRLYAILSKMKFERPKARTEYLTAEDANKIRAKAHALGRHSIALAQAFLFETSLRQVDVIGEWVPMSEPGVEPTGVFRGDKLKWVRGIRWDMIDDNLLLTHATAGQKPITIDLKKSSMVTEELERVKAANGGKLPKQRDPVIVSERLRLPWNAVEFRRQWRILADACNISKNVRSSDSAGDSDLQDAETEGTARVAK